MDKIVINLKRGSVELKKLSAAETAQRGLDAAAEKMPDVTESALDRVLQTLIDKNIINEVERDNILNA